MELRGRTFLVTGGGSGLGAATARALEESGANAVVADLMGEGPRFVETDVTDEESVRGPSALRARSSARCMVQ